MLDDQPWRRAYATFEKDAKLILQPDSNRPPYGGGPTMHPDCMEFAAAVAARRMSFDIYATRWYTLLMRILKTRKFAKLATSEGLTDEAIKDAIKEFEEGLTGDALGANLYKKRVSVGSKGKSGGLRTILVYKAEDDKVFCVDVFPKNKKENISKTELAGLKRLADYMLRLKETEIKKSIETKALIEVK